MYPVPSARFLPGLLRSHRVISEVQLITTSGTTEVLPHTGGEVVVDRGQAVRRSCTVQIDDVSLIPTTAADKLTVYGAQLLIYRGLEHDDGLREMVPVGVFRIDEVAGDLDVGPVEIHGSGVESYVVDDQFTSPRRLASATSAVAGIASLIQETLPAAVVTSQVTDSSVGNRTWDREDDRWEACRELATAIGAEVYADADGQFTIKTLPDVSADTVVWEVAAGESGALISAVRGMSRDGTYNSVTAFGENTEDNTAPVSATVEDTDPTSPTYVGTFGRVTRFYSSPTLTTVNACTSAATAILRDRAKPNATCDLTALPNPALEPGDVIRAVYANGFRELHQIHSLRIDLGTAAMTMTMIGAQED